jgi:outer membrane protein assembly factor BamB
MTGESSRRGFLHGLGAGSLGVSLAGCAAPTHQSCPGSLDRDGPLAESADATFRGNLQRQGYRPDETVPDSVTVDWELRGVNTGDHTAAKASAVPAADGSGDVVIPGDTGEIHRVTPGGEVRWTAATFPSERGIHGTPTVANGAVFVGAYDGVLYAFDLASGERRWCADLGDAIGSSPGYHDGTVFVAVEFMPADGKLFGVDAATGDVAWVSAALTDHPHSTAAIDRDAGRVGVGANDGTLYGWSYPDIGLRWRFQTGGAIKGPVATYDGAAFAGSWDGRLYRVALDDGAREWAFETDGRVMSGPAVDPRTDTVYVGSHDRRLYALDAATGDRQWAFETRGRIVGCPTVTRDRVLVGSYDGGVYALDRGTGREVWRVENTGWVTSSPVVRGGGVYYAERATRDRPGSAYRLGAAS